MPRPFNWFAPSHKATKYQRQTLKSGFLTPELFIFPLHVPHCLQQSCSWSDSEIFQLHLLVRCWEYAMSGATVGKEKTPSCIMIGYQQANLDIDSNSSEEQSGGFRGPQVHYESTLWYGIQKSQCHLGLHSERHGFQEQGGNIPFPPHPITCPWKTMFGLWIVFRSGCHFLGRMMIS